VTGFLNEHSRQPAVRGRSVHDPNRHRALQGLATHATRGPTATSIAYVVSRKLILAAIVYGAPPLLVGCILTSKLLSLRTIVAQLLTTAIVFSLALTISLLHYSVELNQRYNRAWVKFLDFPYIALAVFGLYRVLESSYPGGQSVLSLISITALALALAIRLTKATIETYFDDVDAPPG